MNPYKYIYTRGVYMLDDKDWKSLEFKIKARDGNKCLRCHKRKNLTAHHLKPRASGGSDEPRNLVTLCAPCHNWVEVVDPKWTEIKRPAPKFDNKTCCNSTWIRNEFGLVKQHEQKCSI
jgi:HNH endonuclease